MDYLGFKVGFRGLGFKARYVGVLRLGGSGFPGLGLRMEGFGFRVEVGVVLFQSPT